MAITAAITALGPLIGKIIGKAVKDKDLAEKLTHDVNLAMLTMDAKELEGAVQIITAEANSQSWLARNWRPMVMIMFASIIANNYILYPYMQAIFGWGVELETPPDLWALMKIGLGGYIVGRSAEQGLKIWKTGDRR